MISCFAGVPNIQFLVLIVMEQTQDSKTTPQRIHEPQVAPRFLLLRTTLPHATPAARSGVAVQSFWRAGRLLSALVTRRQRRGPVACHVFRTPTSAIAFSSLVNLDARRFPPILAVGLPLPLPHQASPRTVRHLPLHPSPPSPTISRSPPCQRHRMPRLTW